MANGRYRHIFLQNPPLSSPFTSPRRGAEGPRIPERDRARHSAYLKDRLEAAWAEVEQRQAIAHVERDGIYLDFVSDPGTDLVLRSLEDRRSGIRLLNVRREDEGGGQKTKATVYVPHARRGYFLRKITKYAEEEDRRSGKPKNQNLINSIADIRRSVLESFWQDHRDLLPGPNSEWVEVWLSNESPEAIQRFDGVLRDQGIQKAEGVLKFPERAVEMIRVNRLQLEALIEVSDDIAELRLAKEVASVLVELENREQLERVREFLERTEIDEDGQIAVCILDTGINNGHLLIQPVLSDADRHTTHPDWGAHDHNGHGTRMAGLAAYGNLLEALQSRETIRVTHRLESAKILPPPPEQTDPKLWGYFTAQGISMAEIEAPQRKRVICLAVTATDFRDLGRPSSWSAKLDELASAADEGVKRLVVVSAGNVGDSAEWRRYPDSNMTNEVHDPGQAWNALTVGACTEKVRITDVTLSGYQPVAPYGGLSPFSTTSLVWQRKWPIKPEVLFEGGNVAAGPNDSIFASDDLALLSTYHNPAVAQFVPFSMTSAATAQASWMAAKIQREYPNAWPETVRALIVHSATWTDAMKMQFLGDESKASYRKLLRTCGYGIPHLDHALSCAVNLLTLVSQAEIQPYDRNEAGSYITREMHLYDLPWPRDALLDLGETQVQMRVTLSYFIEPGPGEVGWQDRYRYASFALRFAVKGPAETENEFVRRVNSEAREDGEHPGTAGPTDKWVIGDNTRNVGSIHSDIWKGTAADLADSNRIAVFPAVGWWRERSHLGKWNKRCRYSLVVSIQTPEQTVDIYTPVAVQVGVAVPIQIRAL